MSNITASFFVCIIFSLLQGCTGTMEGLQRDFQSFSAPGQGTRSVTQQSQEQSRTPDFLELLIADRDVQEIIGKGRSGKGLTTVIFGKEVSVTPIGDSYLNHIGRITVPKLCRNMEVKTGKKKKDFITVCFDERSGRWVYGGETKK